jgi:signal transduction histidine kinase
MRLRTRSVEEARPVQSDLRAGRGGDEARELALLPQLGHELRTPVQVIAGFVDLLLAEDAGPLTPEQRRYLEEARRSCERLARFAAELSAGADAVTAPLVPQRAALARLAESAGASMKISLDRRRQTLRVRIAGGAEHGWFDPARVLQVLENLVANASEHGPEGGVIDVEVERALGSCGSALVVSVTDDGPGLRARPAPRPGRGLGLAICRAIVAAHGGELAAGDAPGRGARVRFTLPDGPERAR